MLRGANHALVSPPREQGARDNNVLFVFLFLMTVTSPDVERCQYTLVSPPREQGARDNNFLFVFLFLF
jgi:hypothetical protein